MEDVGRPKLVKHLLFDLDGTLTDSREGIVRSIQHALVTLGQVCPDPVHLEQFIGPPLNHSFRMLLDDADEALVDSAVAAYRARFSSVGIFENRVYPDIPGTLQTLQRAGRILHVVTSKPVVFARTIIEHFDLAPYFSSVCGPALDDRSPDKSSLIRRTLDSGGFEATHAVMIGDREHDIVGARRNGIAAVGVTWGYGSLSELTAAAPDHLVDSPAGLLDLFGAA